MKTDFRPHLALIVANLVWASDYPVYKLIMPHFVSPVAMAASAVTVAGLFALIANLFTGFERVERKDVPKLIGAALLVSVMRKLFLMEGLSRTSPVDGAIIDSIDPVLVLVISVIIGIDSFSKRKVWGVVLGVAGTLAIVLLGGSSVHHASTLWGNVLVLGCAVVSAVYLVLFKQIVRRYRPTTLMLWVYGLGALFLLPFGAKDLVHTDFASFTHTAWWAYLFVLILPTFAPNLLLAWSLRYVQPTVSSIYGYIQPIVATAIAVSVGMDHLRWETVIAALVIFTGLFLVIKSYSAPNRHTLSPRSVPPDSV